MRRMTRRLLGSVRVRITATALLAVACALGVAAAVLNAGIDHDRSRILATTAQEQARVVTEFNPDLSTRLVLPDDATIDTGLVQVLRDGKVVAASRPLRGLGPLWLPGDPTAMRVSDPIGGLARDVRVVAVPVTASNVKAMVVVVLSLDQYDHTVAYLQQLISIGMPVLLILVGLISWFVVGRALRPIELMRREVAEVATIPGSHRVPEPANDDEVRRLARTLNSMLDRIEASSARERRFVSDASHELRSPIANIRTELEVALHHPGATDWSEVAAEVLAENERMESLVAGLLLLARSDEGSLLPAAEPVDLAQVAADMIAPYRTALPLVEVLTEPAPVRVPRVYLERMVANLVDNARRFARSTVILTARTEAGMAVLRVQDDGPGVPEVDRRRIFERFVRLDEARDRDEGGFGLGLAIVADLSRFYGGTIEVEGDGPGAQFVLRLPGVTRPEPVLLS
ncbi:MAG: HAMP domain-containing histidine kinase [Acidimicrobiales bacterium]|nr:HAMP domain-containing histidine kinase [Acidimicrobiales bacterium]